MPSASLPVFSTGEFIAFHPLSLHSWAGVDPMWPLGLLVPMRLMSLWSRSTQWDSGTMSLPRPLWPGPPQPLAMALARERVPAASCSNVLWNGPWTPTVGGPCHETGNALEAPVLYSHIILLSPFLGMTGLTMSRQTSISCGILQKKKEDSDLSDSNSRIKTLFVIEYINLIKTHTTTTTITPRYIILVQVNSLKWSQPKCHCMSKKGSKANCCCMPVGDTVAKSSGVAN